MSSALASPGRSAIDLCPAVVSSDTRTNVKRNETQQHLDRLDMRCVLVVGAVGCGGTRSPKSSSPVVVEAVFRDHGLTLINSNLVDQIDNGTLDALYFAADPRRGSGDTVLFVGVFANDQDARRYAVAEASPLADGGETHRVRNVTLYLRRDGRSETRLAALAALDELDRAKGGVVGRKDYSVADVESAFEVVTGSRLQVDRPLDLRRMKGGVTVLLAPNDEDLAKYGEFRFVVQTERPREPLFDAMTPPHKPLSPGGVYWGRVPRDGNEGPDEPEWGLSKYLGNVKVVWFTNARELDERWRVLDEVLERLKRRGKT